MRLKIVFWLAVLVNGAYAVNDPVEATTVRVYAARKRAYYSYSLELPGSSSASRVPVSKSRRRARGWSLLYPYAEEKEYVTGEPTLKQFPTGCFSKNIVNEFEDIQYTELTHPGRSFALMVARGECTFEEKIMVAEEVGASALIVFNTELDYYFPKPDENGKQWLKDPCSIDCGRVKSLSKVDCEESSFCHSDLCLSPYIMSPDFSPKADEETFYCCAKDNLIEMETDPDLEFAIPAVFIGTVSAQFILDYIKQTPLTVRVYENQGVSLGWFFSLVLMWSFAVFSVMIGALFAARDERKVFDAEKRMIRSLRRLKKKDQKPLMSEYKDKILADRRHKFKANKDEVKLSDKRIILFFAVSSVSLLCCYFLLSVYPREFVILLIYLFALAATSPVSELFCTPIAESSSISNCCLLEKNTKWSPKTLGFIFALALSFWFVSYRHFSFVSWLVQDFLGFCFIYSLLRVVKIDRMEHCFKLLGLFCAYDVFMTFVTPLLFSGKSVMMEVASGMSDPEVAVVDKICSTSLTETMPMLFLIPRSFSFTDKSIYDPRVPSNFGVLGFGDVFIPGLVVVYCLRLDYFKMRADQFDTGLPLSTSGFYAGHGYTRAAVFGYGVGFFLTIMANFLGITVFGVQGQPALLYIAPLMLFLIRRRAKGFRDYNYLWDKGLEELQDHLLDVAVIDVAGDAENAKVAKRNPETMLRA